MKRKKKKKGPAALFFRTLFTVLIVGGIVTAAGFYIYGKAKNGEDKDAGPVNFISNLISNDVKFNMAVFGVDADETRTDVIFVVHFDSKENQLSLLSVPRDTRVEMTGAVQSGIREAGRYVPYGGICKMNEVHAYAGKEHGAEYAVMQLEDLLDIKIDYYAKVNLEGFKSIVDAVDGVYVDVPRDMNYKDPEQDLYINLKAGPQTLDGAQAEQLVRFRSYVNGDVDRVATQQIFLKEFAKKVLSTDTIVSNLGDYIRIFFKYVETDFNLADALKYSKYVKNLDAESITMETLPGSGQYVGDISYYLHDEEATKEAVERIFGGHEKEVFADSKEYAIEVANGGNVNGLASAKQNMLNEKGYNVTKISTYEGEKNKYTRILVSGEGMGADLAEYFSAAKVEVDKSLSGSGVDIKIILGTNEK